MYFWIVGSIVFLIDRWTKHFIVQNMQVGDSLPVIKDFLYITYIKNPGAAFGLLAEKTWLFIVATVAILIVLIYLNATLAQGKVLLGITFGLVAGGAVGNLLDRLQSGLVVDFIYFRGVWPYVFNVADSAIVIGTVLLAWQIIITECFGNE